jgi:hypothetical protein
MNLPRRIKALEKQARGRRVAEPPPARPPDWDEIRAELLPCREAIRTLASGALGPLPKNLPPLPEEERQHWVEIIEEVLREDDAPDNPKRPSPVTASRAQSAG